MPFPDVGTAGGDLAARLQALRERPLNFDPETIHGPGWKRDHYRQPLTPERPGAPEPGGSWETARRISRAYAFADPALVEAHFDPSVPLEQRELLLVLHALGLRIYAGVRVGAAGEVERTADGRAAQISFWNYQTLAGHVEAGQRDYEVWKWLDTGAVEFRTHAVSRPAESNPLVMLGFRVLGRHKQVEFGRRACMRMRLLTAAALEHGELDGRELAFDGRLLAIYLRDHHALLVAMRELAARMLARTDERHAFAEELLDAANEDLAALETQLALIGSSHSAMRDSAVWLGEKLGRLKLNGRLVRPSPLSAVVELESCLLVLESTRALWTTLAQLGLGPADARQRTNRALELAARGDALRVRAVETAIHTPAGNAR